MKDYKGIFRSVLSCSVLLMAMVSCGGNASVYKELTGYAQGGTYSVKFKLPDSETGVERSELRSIQS